MTESTRKADGLPLSPLMPESVVSTDISITSAAIECFLHCPTKSFLCMSGEKHVANAYANWQTAYADDYRRDGTERIRGEFRPEDVALKASDEIYQAAPSKRLYVNVVARYQNTEAVIHAVESVTHTTKPTELIPVRFSFRNKLSRIDKILLTFDAYVLSNVAMCKVHSGKFIHGDDRALTRIKIPQFDMRWKRMLGKVSALLSESQPPRPILNRHCPECEFQDRCRELATASDDLSLLSRLSTKERAKLNSKGIFSVTQLSHTFRPRRRSKHNPRKLEKYHHSLKALAIRDRKTYIVGAPLVKIVGTPVFIDVEGLPDRDFYYLIGVRVECSGNTSKHALWADNAYEERSIWQSFLGILSNIDVPILIHYGNYEAIFLRRMCARYGAPAEGSVEAIALDTTINVLSVIYARVYFPVYSNGLKEIASYLGFVWSEPMASGLHSLIWRYQWEKSHDPSFRKRLIIYNAEDCEATSLVIRALLRFEEVNSEYESGKIIASDVVHADSIRNNPSARLGTFKSSVSGFEQINASARWDYQRNRIYFRNNNRPKPTKRAKKKTGISSPEKVIICAPSAQCPKCGKKQTKLISPKSRTVHDLIYGKNSLRRKIVKYIFQIYHCGHCGHEFGFDSRFGDAKRKYGWGVLAYFVYSIISLYASQGAVLHILNKLLGFDLSKSNMGYMKIRAASYYQETRDQILGRIIQGNIIHIDETTANIKGCRAYVWVLTNMIDVVYILSENREGAMIHELLTEFKGVLVSDYYAVYDSVDCPQQKCLIHLMRDLNDEVFKNPFDTELHDIANRFAGLLKSIIETVDRRGLKKYFLRKHLFDVENFFGYLEGLDLRSENASKYRQRFIRNRNKLFTFLLYDGVPWNNNNAEHAVKAFATLRAIISGPSTKKGTEEYLTLLSVCRSCEYRGLDFLDFLRSGEKDVSSFSRRRNRKSMR